MWFIHALLHNCIVVTMRIIVQHLLVLNHRVHIPKPYLLCHPDPAEYKITDFLVCPFVICFRCSIELLHKTWRIYLRSNLKIFLFLLSYPCSMQNIKTKVFTNFECQTGSNFPSVLVLLQYFLNSKLSSCWLEYISHQFYKHLSCKSLDSREFFFTICLFYSYTGSETSVMGQY